MMAGVVAAVGCVMDRLEVGEVRLRGEAVEALEE